MNMTGFLISAPGSGSGKTTVCLAIMAALARRGLGVAPFKCGPDFIDPGYHRQLAGRASINLDAWICPPEFIRETFQSAVAATAVPNSGTVAVIEGAMGLFDGIGASTSTGSSAQISEITGAAVVLVVNARGMAASAVALVKGFSGFDPRIRVAGVIFNNVGSSSHAELLKEALATHAADIRCFGCIPRDEALTIPSRHLGLVTADDNPLSPEFVQRLIDMAETCLDLDGLARLEIPPGPPFIKGGIISARSGGISPPFSKGGQGGICVRIAVARDAAFCFCYEDNLRLLRETGAEIVFFSPLHDTDVPPDIQGIYLPGGYPELFVEKLSANLTLKQQLQAAINDHMPVYAECGGFIYLTEGVGDDGEFVGIFPVRARMLPRRKALGYRQVELTETCGIGPAGSICRGHEFHYSEIEAMPKSVERCYRVSRRGETLGQEGYRIKNCLASYVHLHFGSNPGIAPALLAASGAWKRSG